MKYRYFLEICYNGTHFFGWQQQINDNPTIQEMLNNSLSCMLSDNINVIGCGRTDTGVHAKQFFLHFDTTQIIPPNIVHRLNRLLPSDIAVYRIISDLPEQAHARFDATYRAYIYNIHFSKNPFLKNYSYFCPPPELYINKMQQAAQVLLNYNNFEIFSKTGGNNNTFTCNIFESEIIYNPLQNTLQYRIAANRFLRGMVRLIVGALLMIGKNKIDIAQLNNALLTNTKLSNIISVPPNGLFLQQVKYPYLSDIERF